MKKIIAKEFLWFLLTIALAFLLGFVFLFGLDLTTSGHEPTEEDQIFVIQFYLLGFVLSFVGIYLIRLIVVAMKVQVGK
ncbi:MAG: hypothetical protein AAF985_06695 [Bacteroidota bacterium]